MSETRRFDEAAVTWDETPRRVALARDVATAIRRRIPVTPDMDVMDYGCGTGLVTLELQPHVSSLLGLDTSPGMLEVLDRKIREQGLGGVTTAHLRPEAQALGGPFHLIVSSMTLHHVEDPGPLFRRFHDALHPGGWLCLADLDAEDGTFHDDMTGVFHAGFDRQDLQGGLAAAGFVDVTGATAAVISKSEKAYPVFLVAARKPA